MRIKSTYIIRHVFLPLLLGGLIYACWRTTTLWMFDWWRILGIEQPVLLLRNLAAPFGASIPNWVLFSLPDGLWVYAVTAFMSQLWFASRPSFHRNVWLSSGLILGLTGELGQLFKLVPGRFDWVDLSITFLAFFLAVALAKRPLHLKLHHAEKHHNATN